LGRVVVEARMPDHEVLKWFKLNGSRYDRERGTIAVSVDESLVQCRHQVRAG
jgi:hypothetical protein